MNGARIFLLGAGCVLVIGAITGYLATEMPKPTLYFIGATGVALLFWHNAAVSFQRLIKGQK